MPRSWNDKDERQYRHIRDQARERGLRRERAEEMAARTVNKQRRREGRASGPDRATGNPHLPLPRRTRRELYNLARERGIDGRSRMNKGQLVAALRQQH